MIRTLLTDDQPLIRALLESESDITVVAEAGDGAEGVELVRRHRPDVVLLELGARDRAQLVVHADESGLVRFGARKRRALS